MAFIKPSREQYKPELQLTIPGQYLCRCRSVTQGMPNPKYEGKTNLAIEFEIQDDRIPKFRGQRVAIVCPESVYRDPTTGKESYLLQYARMMGVPNPEKGFDPETFIGKWYWVTAVEVDGKCVVRAALPMPAPVPGQPAGQITPPSAPPVDHSDGERVPF